jgi:hypothetical protein
MVALFLSQWLRSIERDEMAVLNTEEARIVSLLRDLLLEADLDVDTRHPMSALLLMVWADQFDGVTVVGSTYIWFLWHTDLFSRPKFGKDFPRRGRCYQSGSNRKWTLLMSLWKTRNV